MKNIRRNVIALVICVLLCFLSMFIADRIQKNFGSTKIETGSISTEKGDVAYKLYIPSNASETNKAPGVLLLHGYQNDHETSAAYAIELSRRGVVVLAIDEYGHGDTPIPMKERGWTNHKVTVNFGEDSEENKTYAMISGPLRYKVLMNFSTLSFFNDRYSKGTDGSAVSDSAMGGIASYAYLSSLPYVDNTRLGISGHSMGTWASWSVAAAYAGAKDEKGVDITPKATVLQCGELFRDSVYDDSMYFFNNVLLLQAKYDEFSYFRDYKSFVTDDLLDTPLRTEFLGVSKNESEWNTTYGSFSDGSARRIELLNTNHRLTTHNKHGMVAALDWFDNAIGFESNLPSKDQVFMIKEWLVFLALLSALFGMIPLMNLLLTLPFFAPIACGIPNRPNREKSGKKWRKGAIITMAIAALTYPFLTQLGHGLFPLPENIFRMTIGNGFLSWYLVLIIIMVVTTLISWKKSKKRDDPLDYADLGFAGENNAKHIDWNMFLRSIVLVFSMVLFMYILLFISMKLFTLDFRFIWPFFRLFSLERFGQFLVYIPIFALFFLLNNSKIFAQMRVKEARMKGAKAFFVSWYHNALCMVGGILIVILIEYIPFFLGIGPGADLLFSPTFGGPFMSLLIVFAPQVIVFSILCTITYRKTGNVFTGALLVATLACWIVTGGSAIL